MLAAVQDRREQLLVGPQIVKGTLANVGAEMLNLVIDPLERQIECKLPHLFDQGLGSCRRIVSCWSGRNGSSIPLCFPFLKKRPMRLNGG